MDPRRVRIGYYCQVRDDGFLVIRGSDPFWLTLENGVWWWTPQAIEKKMSFKEWDAVMKD